MNIKIISSESKCSIKETASNKDSKLYALCLPYYFEFVCLFLVESFLCSDIFLLIIVSFSVKNSVFSISYGTSLGWQILPALVWNCLYCIRWITFLGAALLTAVFSLQHCENVSHFLLGYLISTEKSAFRWIENPFCVI